MAWVLVLVAVFAGLHFVLAVPAQAAIVVAAVVTVGLWAVWKLKWVILGIIGLEELFGGGGDDA